MSETTASATTPDNRLEIIFDPETLDAWPITVKRKRKTNRLPLTVLHYVERPARTPSGGRFTARRFTVRTKDGRKWYGQTKNGTDVVRLRLAEDK